MCGRFSQNGEEMRVAIHGERFAFQFQKNFNLAPSQRAGVIFPRGEEIVGEGFRWGFIPHWAKENPKVKPINARVEGITTSPLFRGAIGGRRCLVPASGWYEWKTENGGKQPYRIIRQKEKPIYFAGIYAHAEPGGEATDTFAIVTREASSELTFVHNRMPVVVPDDLLGEWLDTKSDRFRSILEKPLLTGFEFYPVDRRMNTPAFNGPECLRPLPDSL
ncbi:MAG: SOS response-associated peptidase [Patescibacteria group bacterium]